MNTIHQEVQFITVSADEAGQRIDNFLLKRLKGVPKSRIYRILRKGEVRVNKKRIKPEYKLQADDVVRVPPIRLSDKPEAVVAGRVEQLRWLEQQVIHEDDAILVINKPSGMAVHGGSGLSYGLIEALRALRPDSRFLELVHRIDRDTSGILVIAKKRSALRELHRQLREKEIQKDYLTLVHGQWPKSIKQVDAPLRKNALSSGERIVIVDPVDGKPSKTRYRIERSFSDYTLMKASPITGRTHQIRVHCQSAGHNIAGDDKYCDNEELEQAKQDKIKRLFLHAWRIKLIHPTKQEQVSFEAPLDSTLKGICDQLAKTARY